jgi:DNA polymerase
LINEPKYDEREAMDSSFLPRRAIVMGRRRPQNQIDHQASNSESMPLRTPQPTTETGPSETSSTIPTVPPALTTSSSPANDTLEQIAANLENCTRCKLCEKRKTIVVGEGNPQAELVFVGEGPGEQEDLQGRPFVGKAGQLLDRMIQAMGLQREQVYICNVVKCRPPGNRNPEPDEIEACGQFLARQLDVIHPKVVVALGKFAAQTLLQTEAPISKLRGHFHSYRGAKLMPTFHPAYLLRNPDSKREAWADLQQVAAELGIEVPKRG